MNEQEVLKRLRRLRDSKWAELNDIGKALMDRCIAALEKDTA